MPPLLLPWSSGVSPFHARGIDAARLFERIADRQNLRETCIHSPTLHVTHDYRRGNRGIVRRSCVRTRTRIVGRSAVVPFDALAMGARRPLSCRLSLRQPRQGLESERHRPLVGWSRGRPLMTRQDVYEAVWAAPLTSVAASLGLSPSTVRKACRDAEVPVPGRGHWIRASLGTARGAPALGGRKDEPIVLVKRKREWRTSPCAPSQPSDPATPAARPGQAPEADLVARHLELLEDASRRWSLEQDLRLFLMHVMAGTTQLPGVQAIQAQSVLNEVLEFLRDDHVVRDTLAALALRRQ